MTTGAESTYEGSGPGLRVAVVDDDTVVREGLKLLLTGLSVVGAYPGVEAFLSRRPDVEVVLLDLVLTGTGRPGVRQGARAVAAVAGAGYRCLIYTNERRREVLAGCIAAGARGAVHKAEQMDVVASAARQVAAGEIVITTALAGLAELVQRRGALPTLSPRQQELLRARARGESFRSIGQRLHITTRTAEEHMGVVSTKFAEYLQHHSPADLERRLGLAPGDLLDWTDSNLTTTR